MNSSILGAVTGGQPIDVSTTVKADESVYKVIGLAFACLVLLILFYTLLHKYL